MSFMDLGIPVDAVESRTAAICTNATGDSRVVIAAKGFLLVVDPITENCRQLYFPNDHSDYPYDTFSSKSGLFYVGAGSMFYVFDPFQLSFLDAIAVEDKEELCGFSYAENDAGDIYMASYPQSRLYRYSSAEKQLISLGSMDSEQKYPSHMAIDAYGWVYIGTGTTRKNIIAYNPKTGAATSILADEFRTIGIGLVRQGYEKTVRAGYEPLAYVFAQIGERWVRVEQGVIVEELTEDQVPASLYSGESFGKFHRQLAGDWKVISHSLSDYELIMQHARTLQVKTIKLRYTSDGAMLSPLVLGPDQNIYGTSNHPLHFYRYHLGTSLPSQLADNASFGEIHNMGSKAIPFGAGGNIAAYAVQGNLLVGAAYPSGRLHIYDVTKPVLLEDGEHRNPIAVTDHIEIHRPRCAVALQNGEHVVYGGFPGYGMVGGGLCIYHLPAGEAQLIPHIELIADQSTVALVETEHGTLIGGTSIETPGGAEPRAKTACIYEFDWQSRKVRNSWQLRDGIREYSLLLIDARGWIHALTSCSTYFVWDPHNEQIIYEENLSTWGNIVRQGWQLCESDQCIYGVLSKAIFKIPLTSLRPELLAIPPSEITAGLVKWNNELFFAIVTHLWKYTI